MCWNASRYWRGWGDQTRSPTRREKNNVSLRSIRSVYSNLGCYCAWYCMSSVHRRVTKAETNVIQHSITFVVESSKNSWWTLSIRWTVGELSMDSPRHFIGPHNLLWTGNKLSIFRILAPKDPSSTNNPTSSNILSTNVMVCNDDRDQTVFYEHEMLQRRDSPRQVTSPTSTTCLRSRKPCAARRDTSTVHFPKDTVCTMYFHGL